MSPTAEGGSSRASVNPGQDSLAGKALMDSSLSAGHLCSIHPAQMYMGVLTAQMICSSLHRKNLIIERGIS